MYFENLVLREKVANRFFPSVTYLCLLRVSQRHRNPGLWSNTLSASIPTEFACSEARYH